MVEMATGSLPWGDTDDKTTAYEMKMQKGVDQSMTAELPPQIHAIWRCIMKYSYSDEPNYQLLRSFLVEAMTQNRITFDDPFDWEKMTALQKEHISAISLDIPEGEEPTVPCDLVSAIVPGEEEFKDKGNKSNKKRCCNVQ